MRSEPSLFQRLNDFALDNESAPFKFSTRLARENGWSLAFAKAAIGEYKKFIYLAAISATPVTPSDIVDQVWHRHLTYSRSYWDEMCGKILGKPLHHGPTNGGASEYAKYRDLYAATLEAYRAEFAEEPPPAFWPPSDARFDGAAHQRWVDTRDHLVLPWRAVTRTAGAAVGIAALSSAGVALAADAGSKDGVVTGLSLLGALILVIVVMVAARGGGKARRRGGSGDDGSGSGAWLWGAGAGSSHKNHHDQGGNHHGGHHGGESGGGESGGSDGGSSGCSGGGGCSSS